MVVATVMIGIGFDKARKVQTVRAYVDEHGLTHVVVLSPARIPLEFEGADQVKCTDIIKYTTYYPLLQAINPSTLVVVHECLRTQDRNDLTYNCIRHFLAQTDHVLVFQARPLIDTIDDFATLFDFVTKSRWKRTPFAELPLDEATIVIEPKTYAIEATLVEADAKTKARYTKDKRKRFDDIGLRDPHTIPRNLHLLGGKVRASAMRSGRTYVARNARIKSPQIVTYRNVCGPAAALDFPHRFIDWSDFLTLSGQTKVEAVVTDLKVDQWYLERFQAWCQRVNDAQATLLG
jgi:hypothetical protein